MRTFIILGSIFGILSIWLASWTLHDFEITQSPDGQEYLALARSLAEGRGLTHYKFDGRELFGGWWAPLYPSTIGVMYAIFDISVERAARYLNFMSLFATFLLFSMVCGRLKLRLWIALVLNTLLLTSPLARFSLSVHSEILFLPLTLLGVYFALPALRDNKSRGILTSGIINAINVMVRYAGIGISGGTALAFAVIRKGKLRERIQTVIIAALPTVVIYILWSIYSYFAPKGGFHRSPGFHVVSSKHWNQLGTTLDQWFNPSNFQFWTLISVVGLIAGTIVYFSRIRKSDNQAKAFLFLGISVLGYFGFLLFSISIFDYNTPLSARLMLPILPHCLLLAGIVVNEFFGLNRWSDMGIGLIIIGFVINYASHRHTSANRIHNNGMYLDAVIWSKSEGIAFTRNQLANRKLYSNVPYLLRHYIAYRQDIIMIPYEIKHDRFIEIEKPKLEDQYARIRREVVSDSAAVIIFPKGKLRPGQELLREYLSDEEVKLFELVEVYY